MRAQDLAWRRIWQAAAIWMALIWIAGWVCPHRPALYWLMIGLVLTFAGISVAIVYECESEENER